MTIALFSSLMCPWTPFIRTKANRDLRRAFKINLNVYFLIANHIFQVKLKHPKKNFLRGYRIKHTLHSHQYIKELAKMPTTQPYQ